MIDPLYEIAAVETALRDAARGQFGAVDQAVYAGVLPPRVEAPYVLFVVTQPRLAGQMMSGDQTLDVVLTATSVGKDHVHAARIGSAVRAWLLGRDGAGAFTTDIALPDGLALVDRQTNNDGAPDNVGGVQQWSESFALTAGRHTP